VNTYYHLGKYGEYEMNLGNLQVDLQVLSFFEIYYFDHTRMANETNSKLAGSDVPVA